MKLGAGLLFCEQKRSKKNFVNLDGVGEAAANQTNKSFLLLFFKKEVLPSLPLLQS
ncbi:hypothetical protein [Acidiphilium acidophilum]|uniref:Uncharacterized protein n=1 Tax=Acidiphilium acidophilum TaxID=76588 RepID=A0AAW9DQ09_ACIAO|nr:hypothetical protein [Acidiphilium acidophilum]MDX5930736.1 hypothetical protein [Acidiphilium acidophilum]MEE3501461.1 hypothetical protein [Acidiphilium acidophilum]